jgi:hypothetical protein
LPETVALQHQPSSACSRVRAAIYEIVFNPASRGVERNFKLPLLSDDGWEQYL